MWWIISYSFFYPCVVTDNTSVQLERLCRQMDQRLFWTWPRWFRWVENISADLNAAAMTFLSWNLVFCTGHIGCFQEFKRQTLCAWVCVWLTRDVVKASRTQKMQWKARVDDEPEYPPHWKCKSSLQRNVLATRQQNGRVWSHSTYDIYPIFVHLRSHKNNTHYWEAQTQKRKGQLCSALICHACFLQSYSMERQHKKS